MTYKFPVLTISAMLFVGCSTTATVKGLNDLPSLPATATGVAMPVELQAESDPIASTSGCSFVALRAGGIKKYEIEFPAGGEVLYADLPEGVYAAKEIVCGHRHWDLSFQNWPHFEVFAGRISVVGGIQIFLDTRNMTVKMSGRERNRTDTLRLIGRIPAEARARLVSGYSGGTIVPAEIEKPANWSHWKIDHELKADERSWPTFHACYRGEAEVNGLWLGQLNVDAVYDGGNFVSAEPVTGWNTFSEQFSKCAKAALQDFHPRSKVHLRYSIYL